MENLQKKLKTKFKNYQLLTQALTHRSYLNEAKIKNLQSNERLEFLGDAVLSFIVSHWLFNQFPNKPEGDLTSLRSNLTKTTTLAKISQNLAIENFIILGKGEKEAGGQKNSSILANTLEAIIGALFLDRGLKETTAFLKFHLRPVFGQIIKSKELKDYKSLLQEKTQARLKKAPVYKTTKEEGPDHDKTFTVGVFVEKKLIAVGKGKSKQLAQQKAAQATLEKLNLKE